MATRADVEAQQRAVSSESTNLAIAVDAHKGELPASSLAAWYALARECAAFAAQDIYTFGIHTPESMYPEGVSLLAQLAAWRATLAAMGAEVPAVDWGHAPEAPPPVGRPNPLISALGSLGDALPFLLVFFVVREWNEARR